MNLPENALIQYPTGKWGFVGRVSLSLTYGRKDGSPLTPVDKDEISRLRSIGPRFVTTDRTPYRLLTWATKESAEVALSTLLKPERGTS